MSRFNLDPTQFHETDEYLAQWEQGGKYEFSQHNNRPDPAVHRGGAHGLVEGGEMRPYLPAEAANAVLDQLTEILGTVDFLLKEAQKFSKRRLPTLSAAFIEGTQEEITKALALAEGVNHAENL